jgi:succinoglycan biosynthesis protein ExoU
MADTAIIIAARDASATIRAAIGSALAQADVAQVILVDDASPDSTVDAARSADDSTGRLEIIRLTVNEGPAAARNVALRRVRTAYVCVLDADDILLPGRIARLVAFATAGWDVVADDLLIAGPGGHTALLGIPTAEAPQDLDLRGFVMGNISHPSRPRQELGFLKPLISTAFLQAHGIIYRPQLRLGEDYAFTAEILARRAKAGLVGACGYVAQVRADGLSSRHGTADLKALADVDLDLMALPGLTRAEIAALNLHRRSVLLKYRHRAMLDAKREGRVREAWQFLTQTPRTTSYILRETLRARVPMRAAG